jgi:hypothetical protein
VEGIFLCHVETDGLLGTKTGDCFLWVLLEYSPEEGVWFRSILAIQLVVVFCVFRDVIFFYCVEM